MGHSLKLDRKRAPIQTAYKSMNLILQKNVATLVWSYSLFLVNFARSVYTIPCYKPCASFSIKLRSETQVSGRMGVDPLDMPRTPYRYAKENALKNPPCPITPTLTSSSVHHFIS